MTWLASQWPLLVPLAVGWLAICWMMPREPARSRVLGGLLGIAALLWTGYSLFPPGDDLLRDVMFYVFAGAAVTSAVLMISDRNPVYAALWFAVTTLSVCGLFLLNSAPFLAAATVIVYAGAIVVTFLFVIMLAQQYGATQFDRQAYQPAAASAAAFILLGCLLFTLQQWRAADDQSPAASAKFVRPPADVESNIFSQASAEDLGSLKNVGRSLFTDYLFAVELAGTVLLIATIGTIAIAPRRSQGNF